MLFDTPSTLLKYLPKTDWDGKSRSSHDLIEDYLHFRHPFMKIAIKDGRCHELSLGHFIAEII